MKNLSAWLLVRTHNDSMIQYDKELCKQRGKMAGIVNIAINYNMNKIYKDYPKSILPVKFSKRTGKALKCQFEELDLNLYEKEARMVTFHTAYTHGLKR